MSAKERKQALTDHLKQGILVCDYAPGEDLDEVALCRDFELSRTPVREVFRELDGWGYVELRQNRGARVADLSPSKLRDFFLAAPMIYAVILQLAARHGTAAQLDALNAAQVAFRSSLRGGSTADRALANVRFHEATGEMAGNTYLLPSFQRLLIDHARIGMTFYQPQSPEMVEKLSLASEQHDQIIDALALRDETRAAELAHAHWDLSRGAIELFVMPSPLEGQLGDVANPRA